MKTNTSQNQNLMKSLLTLAGALLSFIALATTYTVSNNPSIPAQYTDLAAAHNAATTGDTLLIAGSTTTYSNVTFSKPLYIVGPGWNGPVLSAKLSSPTFTSSSASTVLQGLSFPDYLTINAANVTLKESYIQYITYNASASNLLVRNCTGFFQVDGIGSASGVIFSNNFFVNKNFSYSGGLPEVYLRGNNSPMAFSTLFTNNLFYNIAFANAYNIAFSNNLIHQVEATNAAFGAANFCGSCSFTKNLVYCATCPLSGVTGSPVLTGNYQGVGNPFVAAPQTAADYQTNNANFNTFNFNLVAASAGVNGGTDGTNVGPQGGAYPFAPNSQNGGLSTTVPVISSFVIQNPVIQQGGTLNIQATSTIPGN
jgi:hypothetical protein